MIVETIGRIPTGKVATYGQVARIAGNPRGARQVVRTLKTQTKKYNLPWYRVINSKGSISISDPIGMEVQKGKLVAEGVEVSDAGKIDLKVFQWKEGI